MDQDKLEPALKAPLFEILWVLKRSDKSMWRNQPSIIPGSCKEKLYSLFFLFQPLFPKCAYTQELNSKIMQGQKQ